MNFFTLLLSAELLLAPVLSFAKDCNIYHGPSFVFTTPTPQGSELLICDDRTYRLAEAGYCEQGTFRYDPMSDTFLFLGTFNTKLGIAQRNGYQNGPLTVRSKDALGQMQTLAWVPVTNKCNPWPLCRFRNSTCKNVQ